MDNLRLSLKNMKTMLNITSILGRRRLFVKRCATNYESMRVSKQLHENRVKNVANTLPQAPFSLKILTILWKVFELLQNHANSHNKCHLYSAALGQKKWHWAGHVARSSASSWLYKVTMWRDSAWQALSLEMGASREVRPSRRRWMKWEEQLRRFCTSHDLPPWDEFAENREEWKGRADAFKAWCV